MSKQYRFLFSPPDGIHFMILSGENLDGFRVLLSELRQKWAPSGPDEEDCVLEMAKANWGKRRHQRFLEVRSAEATCDPNHKAYNELGALDALALTLDLAEQDEQVREALEGADAGVRKHLLRTRPRRDFATTAEWVKGLRSEIFERFLTPWFRLGPPPDEVLIQRSAAFLTDEVITQHLKIEAELDAKYDRALARLLRIKKAKRQLPFREVYHFCRVAEEEARQPVASRTKEHGNG
jgi:hypothetical protein